MSTATLSASGLAHYCGELDREPRHIIKRETKGCGLGAEHTPVCSCGWRGRPESESNDYMSTNLRDQERAHMAGSHA
jgi:hypothetical protein